MSRSLQVTVFLTFVFNATILSAATPDAEINNLLDYFADEWNVGNLTSIESHFHSDFVVITGENTRTREERIGELKLVMAPGEDRGVLSFSGVKAQALGDKHAMAYGRSLLEFKDGTELRSMFTTIYVETPFGWKALLTHE